MKIAFIHNEKKLQTGAHYINDLIAIKLRQHGVRVKSFYPKFQLTDAPYHLRGLSNILFFNTLLEQRGEILKYDLIQGTTYTPLPFLAFPIPVVCHFGSTTAGSLGAVPLAKDLPPELREVLVEMRQKGIISELNVKSKRPLQDIAEIERYVAKRAAAVIATSKIVRDNLITEGVPKESIHVIHNAIEDFWFERPPQPLAPPRIVFLGRIGTNVFDYKLKGLDRLVHIYRAFPNVEKLTIGITVNAKLGPWMDATIPSHHSLFNLKKEEIRDMLSKLRGSILIIPSRYEGFSLSLVEGMSQGLIPISSPVGVAPEIIKQGKNGYLFHSPQEAIKQIQGLLEKPRLRHRLSARAYDTAQMFKADKMAEQLIALYESVLKQNPFKKKSWYEW